MYNNQENYSHLILWGKDKNDSKNGYPFVRTVKKKLSWKKNQSNLKPSVQEQNFLEPKKKDKAKTPKLQDTKT